MNDPTNSRYRYLAFKGSDPYRRFMQENGGSLQKAGVINHIQDLPVHGSYGAMLFTPQWKAKREEIIKRDAGRCVVCQETTRLQVHHRQYHFVVRNNQFKRPWDYPGNLLITLCVTCHKKGHGKYKVPIINI